MIGQLQIACTDVVERHHPGDVLQCLGSRDVVAALADNDGKFGLVVDLLRDGWRVIAAPWPISELANLAKNIGSLGTA
nr:hypothetical protein [Mycolicibacter algericus]